MKNSSIYCFNVGQGDHTLIKFSEFSYGVIDGFFSKSLVKLPALKYFEDLLLELGSDTYSSKVVIEFVCITHFDLDHIKGISKLLDHFEDFNIFPKFIWTTSVLPKNSNNRLESDIDYIDIVYDQVQKAIKERISFETSKFSKDDTNLIKNYGEYSCLIERLKYFKKKYTKRFIPIFGPKTLNKLNSNTKVTPICISPTLDRWLEVDSLDSARFICLLKSTNIKFQLGIHDEFVNKLSNNLFSIVLLLIINNKSCLFLGDITKDELQLCMDEYFENSISNLFKLKADFIHMSHHGSGSRNSVTSDQYLLLSKSESIVLVSAGQNINYKHPSHHLISDLKSNNLLVYSTNICTKCVLRYSIDNRNNTGYSSLVVNKNKLSGRALFDNVNSKRIIVEKKFPKVGLLGYKIDIDSNVKTEVIMAENSIIHDNCPYITYSIDKDCNL